MELLGTLPSLMSLDLSGCNIQDQGVAALGNNPRFRDITLAECPNITDLGLQVRRNKFIYLFAWGRGRAGDGVEQERGGGGGEQRVHVPLNQSALNSLSA